MKKFSVFFVVLAALMGLFPAVAHAQVEKTTTEYKADAVVIFTQKWEGKAVFSSDGTTKPVGTVDERRRRSVWEFHFPHVLTTAPSNDKRNIPLFEDLLLTTPSQGEIVFLDTKKDRDFKISRPAKVSYVPTETGTHVLYGRLSHGLRVEASVTAVTFVLRSLRLFPNAATTVWTEKQSVCFRMVINGYGYDGPMDNPPLWAVAYNAQLRMGMDINGAPGTLAGGLMVHAPYPTADATRLHQLYLALLEPKKSVVIEACTGSVLVLNPSAGTVTIEVTLDDGSTSRYSLTSNRKQRFVDEQACIAKVRVLDGDSLLAEWKK